MREIKFRAWDGEKMRYPNLFNISDLDIPFTCYTVDDLEPGYFYTKELMQYTGLNDKNGKEIYEGDIIRIHDPENADGMGENYKYTTVEFQNGAFKVEYDFGDYDITAIGWAIDDWDANNITYEIIGNIYENPELIG